MPSSAVTLWPATGDPTPPHVVDLVATAAAGTPGPVEQGLELAPRIAELCPTPGEGATAVLWEVLASLGAADLQLARAVEPHLDARNILVEAAGAGHDVPGPGGSRWGVFAAEGPGVRLEASAHDGGWRLSGTKPWCSLAGRLDRALVTAWVDEERRGLFAVDLHAPGVRVDGDDAWCARGLPEVVSLPVALDDVPAQPVGPPGWYLTRDGFAWGGIGVAAVWYGGAVGLARRVAAPRRRPRDQLSHLHLGEIDRHLAAGAAVLASAAGDVDAGRASGAAGAVLALRVRAVVADTCEAVLAAAEHELGPGPQVSEPEYAARLADLRLYLRQHHAERDLAALGRELEEGRAPW
ncbi:acyl-CoA dehydrogenase family protein [Nocardioides coralli]|uniref:acyl-CoA dehydrogenase family protein n=1 Tax=Nocardioides coralli TaxID=2872154 RepID=UPI001CA46392|nr:acyl-CoA dehydrogenase family protein [Nocardioides coralli]QZY29284.1 acyl-CoA/acyl-ACP dehydrogenase [Nocardioides coralli]